MIIPVYPSNSAKPVTFSVLNVGNGIIARGGLINPDPASVTFVLTSEPPLKVAVAVAVLIPRLSAVVRPAPNGSVMFKSNVPSSYPDPAFVIVNPVKDPEVILAVTVAPSFTSPEVIKASTESTVIPEYLFS